MIAILISLVALLASWYGGSYLLDWASEEGRSKFESRTALLLLTFVGLLFVVSFTVFMVAGFHLVMVPQ